MFVTIEHETGNVNVNIWPFLQEKFPQEALGASLLAAYGTWQCEGEVRHLVAQRLVNLSHLLGGWQLSVGISVERPGAHNHEQDRHPYPRREDRLALEKRGSTKSTGIGRHGAFPLESMKMEIARRNRQRATLFRFKNMTATMASCQANFDWKVDTQLLPSSYSRSTQN